MRYFIVLLTLFSLSAWADTSPQRVSEIKMIVDQIDPSTMFKSVSFMHTLPLETPAASRHSGEKEFVIGINHKYFDLLSPAAQNLVIFHELGHIFLGHTELSEQDFDAHEVELEADYFSAFMFKRFEVTNQDFWNFINEISLQHTSPPGSKRAHIFTSIITTGE